MDWWIPKPHGFQIQNGHPWNHELDPWNHKFPKTHGFHLMTWMTWIFYEPPQIHLPNLPYLPRPRVLPCHRGERPMSGRQRQGQQGPHPAAPGRAAWGQGVRGPKNDGCKTWDVTFWQLVKVGKSWLVFHYIMSPSCPHHNVFFWVWMFWSSSHDVFPTKVLCSHCSSSGLQPTAARQWWQVGWPRNVHLGSWGAGLKPGGFPWLFFQGRPWSMPPIGDWRRRAEM